MYSLSVVFLDFFKKSKSLCVFFLWAIFTVCLFTVYVFIYYVPLPSNLDPWIPDSLAIETQASNVIFKIYRVLVMCQTEINICARPFCNFLTVSNIKVRSDYINSTMRCKETLVYPLLSSMGPALSLHIINQKKRDNVSHSNVEAFLSSFKSYYYAIIIDLIIIYLL